MSKCDLQITFDRPDRKFKSGEKISGSVSVQVNKNVNCRALVLCGKHSTHGRGNNDSEEYQEKTLTAGHWHAGQLYEFPFELIAPEYPMTYRGNYLNIDHYVRLRVDIPWAFDPKLEEEFLLEPGDEHIYSTNLPTLHEVHKGTKTSRAVMMGIGAVFLVMGLVAAPCTVGISLIFAVVGLGLLGFNIRSTLAERKLGEVTVTGLPARVFSREKMPVRIDFTPRKSTSVNKVELTLSGKEVCISGSGSNRTTHTHKLLERKFHLDVPGKTGLTAGQKVVIEDLIEIPDTQAYSVKFSDNRIDWNVSLHIDIPKWPDWYRVFPIQIVPAGDTTKFDTGMPIHESYQAYHDADPSTVGSRIAESVENSAKVPMTTSPTSRDPRSFVVEPVVPASPEMRSDLKQIARQLSETDRFNDEAANLVNQLSTDLFLVELVVDRIYETRGVYDDKRYEDGFTVKGTLKQADVTIIIELPFDQNNEIKALNHGDIWTGTGVIINWDGLYEQLQMMGI